MGEIAKPLTRDCRPGDWVRWRQVDGRTFEGVLESWDSNVAIVRVDEDGNTKAVEC